MTQEHADYLINETERINNYFPKYKLKAIKEKGSRDETYYWVMLIHYINDDDWITLVNSPLKSEVEFALNGWSTALQAVRAQEESQPKA